jgi:hypothetical protein
MSILFIILFAMSVFHFVYEGIIIPSLRLSLRFKLFAIRDQLRRFKAENEISDEIFFLLNDSINNAIRLIPHVTLGVVVKALKDLIDNAELRRKVEAKIALIENCGIKELQQIRQASNDVMRKAFLANSFAFMIYLLPISAIVALSSLVIKKVKNLFKYLMNMPIYPEVEIEKIVSMSPSTVPS